MSLALCGLYDLQPGQRVYFSSQLSNEQESLKGPFKVINRNDKSTQCRCFFDEHERGVNRLLACQKSVKF